MRTPSSRITGWSPSPHHAALVASIAATMCGVCAEIPAAVPNLESASIEELMNVRVTTVSRVDERIDDAPGSVYVYTREVIQKRGYRSLGELLQTVPGFTVFHRDLDFVTAVRGLAANDNDKVSLLINGQNLNGAHEQDFSLNGPINLDNVERVEVVVGPSSFFQQANTLAATVNIITKDTDGVDVIVAAGSALKYSATLMAGHHWAPDKFLNFSFTSEAIRGFDAWSRDFRGNLAGRRVTGELDSPSYFGILKGQYGEVTAQVVAYRATWPELHIENGDPRNQGRMVEETYSLFVKDEHVWNDALTSIVRLGATLKEQTRLNDGGAPVNAVEQSVNQWAYTGEIGLRYTGLDRHLLQAGVQAAYEHNFDTFFTFNNNQASPEFPAGEHVPRTTLVDEDTSAVGFYIDDTFSVTKWLKLIGGLRVDQNTRLEAGRWFPGARAAIIIQPTEQWTTKLIYNRSVRMPSALAALNQAWGSDHLATAPSFARVSPQAQDPEILSTFELQEIFYLGKVRLSASLYHQELDGFVTWFAPHTNGGNFRGNGLELNIHAPLHRNFAVWANGSWNDSQLNLFQPILNPATGAVESHHAYTNTQNRIIGSAEYTASLGFDWKITDHLTLSPAVRYFTNQAALDFTSNEYKTIRHRCYIDAALTWDHVLGRDMDLRLSGRNLLDNRSPVASQLNGDTYRPRGAEVVLTVDMRF